MRLLPKSRRGFSVLAVSLVAMTGVVGCTMYRPWEAHYQGRPSGWWADRIVEEVTGHPRTARGYWKAAWDYFRRPQQTAWILDPEIPFECLSFPPSEVFEGSDFDPAAVPVLVELLSHPDAHVRVWAGWCLIRGEREEMCRAIPGLAEMLRDSQPDMRVKAAIELNAIGKVYPREARAAVPDLIRALNDEDSHVWLRAGETLEVIAPEVAAQHRTTIKEF